MIIKSAEFEKSAEKPIHYPEPTVPEIAFAGRSNVGKSSLINTVLNRKKLVRTAKAPGCTRLINFFMINNDVRFVDLPGYGYAKAPAAMRKKWGAMIETYLATRRVLAAVTLIIDIRRDPTPEELSFVEWLNLRNIEILTVTTKADKLSKNKQQHRRSKIADVFHMDPREIVLFSSLTRQGITTFRDAVNDIITRHPLTP